MKPNLTAIMPLLVSLLIPANATFAPAVKEVEVNGAVHLLHAEILRERPMAGCRQELQSRDPCRRSRQAHPVAERGTGPSRRLVLWRRGGNDRCAKEPVTSP